MRAAGASGLHEVDVQRLTEKAKAKLRFGQLVLQHWLEGLTADESSQRLRGAGYRAEERTVRYERAWLGLATGSGPERAPRREVTLVVEVRHE